MQAVGMVDDHLVTCFRRRPGWSPPIGRRYAFHSAEVMGCAQAGWNTSMFTATPRSCSSS